MDMSRKDSVFGFDCSAKDHEPNPNASRFADEYISLDEDVNWDEVDEDWKEERRSRGLVEVPGAASEFGEEDYGFGTEDEKDGGWQDRKERRLAKGRFEGGILNHKSLRRVKQDFRDIGFKVAEKAEEDTQKDVGFGPMATLQAGSNAPNRSTAKWWFTGPQDPPQNTFRWTLPGLSSAQPFTIPGPFYRPLPPPLGPWNKSRFTLPGSSSARPFEIPGPFYRRPPPPSLAQRPPPRFRTQSTLPRPSFLHPPNPLPSPQSAPASNRPGSTGPPATYYTQTTHHGVRSRPIKSNAGRLAPASFPLKRKAGSNELRLAYCTHAA